MNTPTHLLVGGALFARPGAAARNAAALLGALVPDLPIYVLWGWARIAGYAERTVWSELYFSANWQTAVTVANAAPVYALLGALAAASRWTAGWVFALAALAHVALDFPLHARDAHAHLWPLADWRFESPLSYWNPAYHGDLVQFVEAAFGLALSVLLWRRFRSWPVRAVLVVSLALYVAVPAYFALAI